MHVEFTVSEPLIKIVQSLFFCLGFALSGGILSLLVCNRHINGASQCCCRVAPRYFWIGSFLGLTASLTASICVFVGALSWKVGFQSAAITSAIMLFILFAEGGFIAEQRRR